MAELLAFLSKPKGFPGWEWMIKAICSHFSVGTLLSLLLYFIFMRSVIFQSRYFFNKAFVVSFLGGLISILIDLDHVVALFGWAYWRPLHIPLAIIALFVILFPNRPIKYLSEVKIFKKIIDLGGIDGRLILRIWSFCLIVHVIEDFTLGWF